ncbi:MAG: copper amine oxidase N-terminal domain-containing protein [Defluviitaleaceae bacterium]|nr:copper amine oxidase N-terminal domain-containing protein [Defluviitaleaceae bacterium]
MLTLTLSGCASNNDAAIREEASLTISTPPINIIANNEQVPEEWRQWNPEADGFVRRVPATLVQIGLEDGEEVTLVVSGNELVFDGQHPFMQNDEVFVPVYGVFEYLEMSEWSHNAEEWLPITPFTVAWHEGTSTVTLRNQHVVVTVTEGEPTIGIVYTAPQAPDPPIPVSNPSLQRINGEIMIPLRPIAEAFDAEIEWDEATGRLHIFYGNYTLGTMDEDGTMLSFRHKNPHL